MDRQQHSGETDIYTVPVEGMWPTSAISWSYSIVTSFGTSQFCLFLYPLLASYKIKWSNTFSLVFTSHSFFNLLFPCNTYTKIKTNPDYTSTNLYPANYNSEKKGKCVCFFFRHLSKYKAQGFSKYLFYVANK